MTNALTTGDALDITGVIREACAILDENGKILEFNKQFKSLLLKDSQPNADDFSFQTLGSSAVDGLTQAVKGHFVETEAYIDVDGILEGWRAAFIPQPSGHVLMVLAKEAQDFAFFDTLTGLPNRLVALERLEREWERWLRSKSGSYSFGIALADIDRFKRINDQYGHVVGDQALKRVSEWFNASLRAGDWVARWGGEEFLLFFHNVGSGDSITAAERCRKMICKEHFESDAGLRFKMSVSMGVVATEDYDNGSSMPQRIHQMINDADVLLYDAKHEGRNRSTYRSGKDRLNLDPSEIKKIVEEGKLEALGRKITNPSGDACGTFWHPSVQGMEDRAARHLFQSAIRNNLIGFLESSWIDACRKAAPKASSHVSFVVISPHSFQSLSAQDEMSNAIKRHAQEGKELVLVSKYDPIFDDQTKESNYALAEHSVDACLWLPRNPTVPTGLLSLLRPQYVLIDEPFTKLDTTFSDLLRIVGDYGSTLILHKDMADMKVDYPEILYVE